VEFRSPISIRVGTRTELDLQFAKCIELLPEDTVLSEEIKRRFVKCFELEEEKSEIEALKERVSRQENVLRELEAKIRSGVVVEEVEEEADVDEEKMRRAQELAASMTDW
jgi:hypothetical protein